jgi:hypothetical protein
LDCCATLDRHQVDQDDEPVEGERNGDVVVRADERLRGLPADALLVPGERRRVDVDAVDRTRDLGDHEVLRRLASQRRCSDSAPTGRHRGTRDSDTRGRWPPAFDNGGYLDADPADPRIPASPASTEIVADLPTGQGDAPSAQIDGAENLAARGTGQLVKLSGFETYAIEDDDHLGVDPDDLGTFDIDSATLTLVSDGTRAVWPAPSRCGIGSAQMETTVTPLSD